MRLILSVLLVSTMSHLAYAQQESIHFNIEQHIEELVAIPSEDTDYTLLYETLVNYHLNPLNLNKASRHELESIFVLSIRQIDALLQHIRENGELVSLYELQSVAYFDKLTISKLRPFIQVKPSTSIASIIDKDILEEGNNYWLLRYEQTLEKRKGFKKAFIPEDSSYRTPYRGSQGRIAYRFRSQKTGKYRLGISLEKDAGEPFNWAPKSGNFGIDSYNLYYQVLNKGKIKNLIIGDYQLQFAQGLLFSGGFNLGKGAESITNVKRARTGITAHTSQLESGFLRGIAATLSLSDQVEITPFISRVEHDAILRTDSLISTETFIRAIQTSGLHRTNNELSAKNTVNEYTAGANIHFTNLSQRLSAGVTLAFNHFSVPIVPEPTPSNTFRFSGTQNYNVGLDINYHWQNVNLFMEAARSKSGGMGLVTGLLASLSHSFSVSLLARSYDRNFHSLYSQAFSESSGNNINEHGLYIGFKYQPSKKFSFTGYFDRFSFPWIRTRINRPSNGYEFLFRGTYTPSKSTVFYIQSRQESKARNTNKNVNINIARQGIKNNYQIGLTKILSPQASFKSRVQFSNYELNDFRTKGFALIQDAHYQLGKFKLTGRVALFDTEDFENRQYVYERDVLYAFSLPAYSGRGVRRYLLVQYNASRKLRFWVRWSNTSFTDRETISSGQQEIEGSSQNDIKLQLQFRF